MSPMNHKLDQVRVNKRVKLERNSTTPDMPVEWDKIPSIQVKMERMSEEVLQLFLSDPNCPSIERLQVALQKSKPIKFSRETLHSMHKSEDEKKMTEQAQTSSKLDQCEECHHLIDEVLHRWLKEAKKVAERQVNKLVKQISTVNRGETSDAIETVEPVIEEEPIVSASAQVVEIEPNSPPEEPVLDRLPVGFKDMATQTASIVNSVDVCSTATNGTKRKRDGENEQANGSNDVQQQTNKHNDNEACPACLKRIASLEIQNAVLTVRANQADNVITRVRHEEDINKIYKEFGHTNGMIKRIEAGYVRQIQELQQFNGLLRAQNEELKKQFELCSGDIYRIKQAVQATLRRENGKMGSPSQTPMLASRQNSTQLQVAPITQRRASGSVGDAQRVMETNQTVGIMSNAQLFPTQQAMTSMHALNLPQNQQVSIQQSNTHPSTGLFPPVFASQPVSREQQSNFQAAENGYQYLVASNQQQFQDQKHHQQQRQQQQQQQQQQVRQQQKLPERMLLQAQAQTKNDVSIQHIQAQKQASLLPVAHKQRTIYQNNGPVSLVQRSVSEGVPENSLQKVAESQEARLGAGRDYHTEMNGTNQAECNQK